MGRRMMRTMPRELGDERSRYGRKDLRERLDDLLAWPGEHRAAAAILVIVVAGALLLTAVRGRFVDIGDLAAGDCLYVPTAAARDGTPNERPIGEAEAVVAAIIDGDAQRAACDASHGHEVSVVTALPVETQCTPVRPCDMPIALDRAAIAERAQPVCEAAFAGYVGAPFAGSRYTTYPVVPELVEWLESGRRTICLVARVDGQWMDRPARASGE